MPEPARGASGDARYAPPITPLLMEQLASGQGSIWAGLGASWGVSVLWFVAWLVLIVLRLGWLGGVGAIVVGFGGLIACNAVLLLSTRKRTRLGVLLGMLSTFAIALLLFSLCGGLG